MMSPAASPTHWAGGYFKEFTDEISTITGRPFVFNEVRHVQGVTDHNYKGENVDDILWSWQKAAAGYKNDKGLEWGKTERYILVTKTRSTPRPWGAPTPANLQSLPAPSPIK